MDKIRILRDLELLLKIRHQELKVWCLANNLCEKSNNMYFWIQIKRKCVSNLTCSYVWGYQFGKISQNRQML